MMVQPNLFTCRMPQPSSSLRFAIHPGGNGFAQLLKM